MILIIQFQFQAWVLVLDDMVDESTNRRGSSCWYLMDGIGMSAVIDAFLMTKVQNYLLEKYFGHLDCYHKLYETVQEVSIVCGLDHHR